MTTERRQLFVNWIKTLKVKELRLLAIRLGDIAIDDDQVHVADNGVPYWSQTGDTLLDDHKCEWND